MERLQKVLSGAGVASRRAAERLIREGRVTVNGTAVTEMGVRVDPARDAVKVDGRRIHLRPREPTWVLLNKPRGTITSASDPEGRPTVLDLVRGVRARVFPVGRLDYHTEGLLLLTDDGELAQRLLHPRHGVEKTYSVKVRGTPTAETIARIERGGIPIDGRKSAPARVRLVRRAANAWLEISIREGRNRHVRRLFAAVGHPVEKLKRTRMAGLGLGPLPPGKWRRLTAAEVSALRAIADGSA